MTALCLKDEIANIGNKGKKKIQIPYSVAVSKSTDGVLEPLRHLLSILFLMANDFTWTILRQKDPQRVSTINLDDGEVTRKGQMNEQPLGESQK